MIDVVSRHLSGESIPNLWSAVSCKPDVRSIVALLTLDDLSNENSLMSLRDCIAQLAPHQIGVVLASLTVPADEYTAWTREWLYTNLARVPQIRNDGVLMDMVFGLRNS